MMRRTGMESGLACLHFGCAMATVTYFHYLAAWASFSVVMNPQGSRCRLPAATLYSNRDEDMHREQSRTRTVLYSLYTRT